jgi:hypothetical protein
VARQVVWPVNESALGVVMTSPIAGTNSMYIRLDGNNAFNMRMKPKKYEVGYGGGVPTKVIRGADSYETVGVLKTQLYPVQAQMLMSWAAVPINTGQTSPWPTSEIAGDLASNSVYFGYQRSDGTFRRRRAPGCKVSGWSLSCSRQDPILRASFTLVAQKMVGNEVDSSSDPNGTEFPFPTDDTSYPTGPYLFSHTSGNLTIGTSRTQFESIQIDVQNVVKSPPFDQKFPQLVRYLGRSQSTLKAKLNLKASPDDRVNFESQTAMSASVEWNNGTHTFTLNFNGNNVIDDIGDDFPDEDIYEYDLTLANLRDTSSTSNDIALSFT